MLFGVFVTMKIPYITVTNDMLESLDKIMLCGTRGTHLLFSADTIRAAFSRQINVEQFDLDEVAERLRPVLADLMQIDDLDERRDFIESLETPLCDTLVFLYFGFLERYLTEGVSSEEMH
jgi:hypothetical protein